MHIFVWHYWPDYNQWLFNYIINRDQIYLVCDELDCRRLNFMCKVFKGVKLEYLKFANCRVTGQQLSQVMQNAKKVMLKHTVLREI